ncbi:MAG: glycosyltransferase family 4 protein [Actinomycetota bacterium]|nr:glycosyltransferase family 4 protein [Actinomycetota bacterium]
MRIGLVCPYSLTVPGGVQNQVLALARALRASGHDVRVLGPCDGPPPDAGVTPLGDSIPTAANGSIAPLAPDPAAQLRTIRALWDESFDVINVHEPLAPGPTVTTLLLKTAPLVGTFHAAGTSAAYRWLRPGTRFLARRLDVRCAVSADAVELAGRSLGGSYVEVFNGIEVERISKATPTPTEGPTIFFCSRHEPRKGLAQLLEAFSPLPAHTRLWVASDGPETQRLRQRHAGDPRIAWLGRITDEEKAERLAGADVFCAPSLHGESFGIVLLEAMAAKTVVVASSLAGYRNVARPDIDALLTEPGDVAALTEALRRGLEDPVTARRLVASGEQRARGYSMASLAERYLEIFEPLVDRR